MATITSAGTGAWSAGSTWVGGSAPADNDAVVIASGHTVTFDVDTSAWANGIAGITVTGTLSVSTTTSSYMKMKASTTISGAGTFNIGTSGTPIPFLVKFTLTGGSGWYVQGSGGLTMNVYGTEPAYKYVKLSGAEAINSTRLEIDTDLTGDIWAVTDTIRINNINKDVQSEARVISSITSTYIDITVGLTAAKLAGSYIVLITRNVNIIGVGVNVLQNFANGKLIIGSCSLSSDSRSGLVSCTGTSISGGVFSGNNRVLDTCIGSSISGGAFSGNNRVLEGCTGSIISGGIFCGNSQAVYNFVGAFISNGIFSGNGSAIASCTGVSISGGTFSGNYYGLINCIGIVLSGGLISGNNYGMSVCSAIINNSIYANNTYDIRESQFNAYNISLASTTENYLYTNLSRNIYSESIDHDQTAGAFKSWTKGGVTTSVATPVPTGLTRSYQLALENATVEGFFNRRVNVPAGKNINLTLYLRKSASMTYLPRVWVCKYGTEPFTTAGDILHTFTMTNSTDTWETDTYSYTNSADYDVELECRFVGMAATGYVYGQMVDTFAGGGVSKSRIIGGV